MKLKSWKWFVTFVQFVYILHPSCNSLLLKPVVFCITFIGSVHWILLQRLWWNVRTQTCSQIVHVSRILHTETEGGSEQKAAVQLSVLLLGGSDNNSASTLGKWSIQRMVQESYMNIWIFKWCKPLQYTRCPSFHLSVKNDEEPF